MTERTNWTILHVMPEPDLVGTVEAAEILGVSLATIKRLASKGDLPHVVKMRGGTGAYLFDRAVVEDRRQQQLEAAS